jgi:hypothetical protein
LSTSAFHFGKLGLQGRLAPHGSDPKNLLKHHPPHRQEYSGIDEMAMEAPTNPDEPTSSAWGLSGHVNPFVDVYVISS